MGFDLDKYTRSRWLKGSEMEEGVQVFATISKTYEYHFEEQKETKPILSFAELDQELVANKTQLRALADAFGEDPDQWVGKKVMLMPVPSSFAGKPTIMIQRVVDKPRKGKAGSAQLPLQETTNGAPVDVGREYRDSEAPVEEDGDVLFQ